MLQWCADSWDIPLLASYLCCAFGSCMKLHIILIFKVPQFSVVPILDKDLDQYLWTMLPVVDLNAHSLPVAISHHTIVGMGKMLV